MSKEITIIVHIEVKPESVQAFIDATKVSRDATYLNEPGCLRYLIYHDTNEPCKFTLVETYDDGQAIEVHKASKYFQDWKNTVNEMCVGLRVSSKHTLIQ